MHFSSSMLGYNDIEFSRRATIMCWTFWIDSLCVSESMMTEKSCAGMGHNMHISNWNKKLPVL